MSDEQGLRIVLTGLILGMVPVIRLLIQKLIAARRERNRRAALK